MNSAIAILFASLISGVMSLADLRPTAAEVVQILTGVELNTQEKDARSKKQQDYGTPAHRPQSNSCHTALLTHASGRKPVCCQQKPQSDLQKARG